MGSVRGRNQDDLYSLLLKTKKENYSSVAFYFSFDVVTVKTRTIREAGLALAFCLLSRPGCS